MDKIILDEDGYQEYLKEIDEIREKIRKNSSDITEYQSDDAYGDGWHDNFAYEQAIKKENALFHELEIKLNGLNNIEIVKSKKTNNQYVDINTIVVLKFDEEDSVEEYLVTGKSSSNIDLEIPQITLNSPLGKALYKKKVDDTFNYKVDDIELSGKIIDIRNK